MSHWKRVSKRRPCPICEKPDWCGYTGPDVAPTSAMCQRVESDKPCGDVGWLHRLRDNGDWRARRTVSVRGGRDTTNDASMLRLARDCHRQITIAQVEQLSRLLGVSVDNLWRLRVGWHQDKCVFTFPMRRDDGTVCGIRLRSPNGFKWSVTGSKTGIFVPTGQASPRTLLICEGPTDLAAMLDLGFDGIGRPDCRSGVKAIVDYVRHVRSQSVIVVADVDSHGAGQKGAETLAAVLAAYVTSLRVIQPPNKTKDARDWKRPGATRGDVLAVTGLADEFHIDIKVTQG